MLKNKYLIVVVLALFWPSLGHAVDEEAFKKADEFRSQGYSLMSITRVYGQVVAFNLPQGFRPAFEKDKGDFYIQEFVPKDETVDGWTQMITMAGSKGLSSKTDLTPEKFAIFVANGFWRACPNSFSALRLGERQIDGHDAYVAVVGCGQSPMAGNKKSETVLAVVIKGDSDYYTLQWSERGPSMTIPMSLDKDLWNERLDRLLPIKLCAVTPGETKPYPSCASRP